jgi:hypothetical protein
MVPEKLILNQYILPENFADHIWEVQVEIEQMQDLRLRRIIKIFHKGVPISLNTSRAWSAKEND